MQKAAGKVDWDDVGVCRTLRKTYGLDPRQALICKSWRPVMQHVSRAAALAVVACQTVLQNRRWNCSSVRDAPRLTPELAKGWKTRLRIFFFFFSHSFRCDKQDTGHVYDFFFLSFPSIVWSCNDNNIILYTDTYSIGWFVNNVKWL